MARLDVPGNVIEVLLESYRRESTGMRTVRAPAQPLEVWRAQTRRSRRTLAAEQLGCRQEPGGGEPPRGDGRAGDRGAAGRAAHHLAVARLKLASGDVLYLVGDESDIMLARRRLSGDGGPRS